MLLSIVPLLMTYPFEQSWTEIWQTQLALGGFMLGALVELMFWRGPLGVITRSMKSDAGKSSIVLAISVRILILRWSIALWQGCCLVAWMQCLLETVTGDCFADHMTVSSPWCSAYCIEGETKGDQSDGYGETPRSIHVMYMTLYPM